MGALEGRVAIITGAGRGLGREHALLFAAEGAKVVVNDRGGANDGSGSDVTPAQQVVDDIAAKGGEAIANYDDVADWEGAQRLINTAIETFGDLDILVNNAGILRDRVLVNMSEAEWDDVVRVHLKGHFAPSRWAAAYWREEAKAGRAKPRNMVHTSSTSGLFANPDFFGADFGEGLFYGGGLELFGEQVLANVAAIIWSFVFTFGIMVALKKTIGVRVSEEVEATGLDLAEHGETAYRPAALG